MNDKDRKALIIGIDDYQGHALKCCVNDAKAVAELLKYNCDSDKTLNFDIKLMTCDKLDISNYVLTEAVSAFFKSTVRVRTAVFYFAGHGILNPHTGAGYIMGRDAGKGGWGLPMAELLELANDACGQGLIQSAVIVLDCCHGGKLGDVKFGAGTVSHVGHGVTILAACTPSQLAKEGPHHGAFTELLIDGLEGACADVRGIVTPAAIYSHIDQAMGTQDEQRPLYKANVYNFVTLRQLKPSVSVEALRRLPLHFPDPWKVKPLDPSFEHDRQHVSEEIRNIPVNPQNAEVFKELQAYSRQGLVVPVDAEFMFFAAIQSKGCRLTALGRHYHRLAASDRL